MIIPAELPSKFILIGEDDIDDEDMLREVFASVDDSYALFFFHSGNQILEQLEQLPPDRMPCLLVLDYNMPELNGAEILKRLQSSVRYSRIPKVIWSTSGSNIYKAICLELGANDYITKPASLQEFTKVARHMLSFC